jgi:hypothetical protein
MQMVETGLSLSQCYAGMLDFVQQKAFLFFRFGREGMHI